MGSAVKGLAVSQGIGIGKLAVLESASVIEKNEVTDIAGEILKLDEAFADAADQLERLYNEKREVLGEENAMIFQAHLLMVQDEIWQEAIRNLLKKEKVSAESAVYEESENTAAMFEKLESEYMQERAHDIRDVARRVIRLLRNEEAFKLSELPSGTVLAAEDLTPSDTAQLIPENIEGIVTAIGGSTSHAAIIANSLGIPAVMGVGKKALEGFMKGATVIVDGGSGDIILDPSEVEIELYRSKIGEIEQESELLKAYKGKESLTLDGRKVELAANIASPDDLKNVIENDADGIGLFRSEFLFMDRKTAPSEEEQYIAYRTVLEAMGGKPVIIRTMDIGGDKKVPYLNMEEEMNPFLGYRAIRYCLKEQDVFRTQLRALLRAGVHGNLKVMFPMISSVQELRMAKGIVRELEKELSDDGIAYSEKVQYGIMIEVPAAALVSDLLAKEVDFFSIGTNDLIQYTVAVDRMNAHIAELYTPYNPALLRLIHMTVENAHKAGIPVGMCGSAAGDLDLQAIFLAMGLDELSMAPRLVLKARKRAAETDVTLAESRLAEMLMIAEPDVLEDRIKSMML